MTKVYYEKPGEDEFAELEFEDFLNKFNKTFPNFVLQPDEIFKFWSKNQRRKTISLTPELDKQLDEQMERLEEVMNE